MSSIKEMVESAIKVIFVPVHPAGWPIIAIFALVTLVGYWLSDTLGFVLLIATAWSVYFFRDPVRYTPSRDGLVVSPADGVVCGIAYDVNLPKELDEADDDNHFTRISIFLNVFDVHVNRAPIAGEVKQVVYTPGKFLNASLDKASDDNERSAVLLETKNGQTVAFVQIAGLVARRIICDLDKGQHIQAGEKYGIIRFGSRADVYLPKGVNPLVAVGQRMIGGETVLADFESAESARTAEARA